MALKLRQIIYFTPLGPATILYDLLGNKIFEGPVEEAQTWLEDTGDEIVETIEVATKALADAIVATASAIGSGLLDLIKGAGIATMQGVEAVYDYTAEKIGDKKVQLVSYLTMMAIMGFTANYIIQRITR